MTGPGSGLLERLIRTDPRPYRVRAAEGRAALDALLRALGNPQEGLPVIQIVGSKGKGSTALVLEALLRAAGERVGTFTSPHLSHWTERIRLDGEPCPDADFDRLLSRIEAIHDEHTAATRGLRFFDALTAAALTHYREQAVDRAIIEAGLGGVHDATAVVRPQGVILTTVEREHTAELGDDLAGIAREKVGILPPETPLTLGPLTGTARDAALAVAQRRQCPVLALGRDFSARSAPDGHGQSLIIDGPWGRYDGKSPLPSPHLGDALALAIAALWQSGYPIPDKPVLDAVLASLSLPARCEWVGEHPRIMVDAAHTQASLHSTVRTLAACGYATPHLLLGFSAGKPLSPLLDALPPSPRVTVTRPDAGRSASAQEIADAMTASGRWPMIHVDENPQRALATAVAAVPEEGALLVTGSVYLAGLARQRLLNAPPPSAAPGTTQADGTATAP